ncbi:MAG TPA: hypothetical protein VLF18_21960 [Tahibacter sp.]|uniref:hypothetical protein n=1 Tax=Tahibacter sp. TaxID=2056211 RepID=UPI002CE7F471|nr:hypothetical protein [Tahibacter sp.]HSX62858.1 hypothetical protein [Tahibacter sp.]
MEIQKRNLLRAPLAGAFTLLLGGLAATGAQAQNYEAYYGERDTLDAGEDVKSVNYCPRTGSIVAGTRRTTTGIEALVTRVDDNGVALWQYGYRVGGSTRTTSNAIVELRDGTGFALTGSMVRTDTHIYVMRINCDGKPVWTRVLGNTATGSRAIGYDIIEAGPVLSPVPPPPSQLIVVGDENLPAPAGAVAGRIVRLTSAGGFVWDRAYAQPNHPLGLRFRAVTENRSANANLPDIVVAGSAARGQTWATDRRGLMFRTLSTGAPVCNAVLGNVDSTNEDYYGITRLTAANFNNESVLVGATQAATAAGPSVYLTRFNAGGCVPLVQSVWRDLTAGATAFDVVESIVTTASAPTVVATGTIAGATVAGDGFALTAVDANLGPFGGQYRYSTQSDKRETLLAIDNKRDRFVMAGSTFTDWDAVNDTQDFYLVQTDPNKKDQCVREWDFSWSPTQLPYQVFTPPIKVLQAMAVVETEAIEARDEGYCCQLDPN